MLQRSGRAIGLIEPCLPSPAKAPPSGPDWLHEIKHDSFRIIARRDAKNAIEPRAYEIVLRYLQDYN